MFMEALISLLVMHERIHLGGDCMRSNASAVIGDLSSRASIWNRSALWAAEFLVCADGTLDHSMAKGEDDQRFSG
jgi:hypothetical protein